MPEKWFVYIIECENGSFYIGISQNPSRRLKYHSDSQGSLHTRAFKPHWLVWTEEHGDISSARKREMQLKRWTRRKKLALISGNFTLLKKL